MWISRAAPSIRRRAPVFSDPRARRRCRRKPLKQRPGGTTAGQIDCFRRWDRLGFSSSLPSLKQVPALQPVSRRIPGSPPGTIRSPHACCRLPDSRAQRKMSVLPTIRPRVLRPAESPSETERSTRSVWSGFCDPASLREKTATLRCPCAAEEDDLPFDQLMTTMSKY